MVESQVGRDGVSRVKQGLCVPGWAYIRDLWFFSTPQSSTPAATLRRPCAVQLLQSSCQTSFSFTFVTL
jgi:hypothetical protein